MEWLYMIFLYVVPMLLFWCLIRHIVKSNKENEKFPDSYILKWTLKTHKCEIIDETHDNISITDFETIYENNQHMILHAILIKR